jgi:predicted  nucleic acid-binding Zn-ribbon protein
MEDKEFKDMQVQVNALQDSQEAIQREHASKIKSLQDSNDSLQKRIGKLESSGETSAEEEKEIPVAKIPTDTFKSGDKKYKFTIPQFNHKGEGIVTAEEALKNQDLLDELVTMKSAAIKEVF